MSVCRSSLPPVFGLPAAACIALLVGCEPAAPHGPVAADGPSRLILHGSMHEVIGQQRHGARIGVDEVVRQSHVYAVGAVAGLRGEITIVDSVATVSGVNPEGAIVPFDGSSPGAALLVGQVVPSWTRREVRAPVPHADFDAWIAREVADAGLAGAAPLVFTIEGELEDVRVHVINGACPVHARTHGEPIDPAEAPFEREAGRIRGVLVGVFAPDAAGTLTHPGTSTHSHLVFIDEATGARVTGHLERMGVGAGAVLSLPASGASGKRDAATGRGSAG